VDVVSRLFPRVRIMRASAGCPWTGGDMYGRVLVIRWGRWMLDITVTREVAK